MSIASVWDDAGAAAETADAQRRLAMAKAASAGLFAFLAGASSDEEFVTRATLQEAALTACAAEQGLEPITLVSALREDWKPLLEARQAAEKQWLSPEHEQVFGRGWGVEDPPKAPPVHKVGDHVTSFRGEHARISGVYPNSDPGKSHRVQVQFEGDSEPDPRHFYEQVFSPRDLHVGKKHKHEPEYEHSRGFGMGYGYPWPGFFPCGTCGGGGSCPQGANGSGGMGPCPSCGGSGAADAGGGDAGGGAAGGATAANRWVGPQTKGQYQFEISPECAEGGNGQCDGSSSVPGGMGSCECPCHGASDLPETVQGVKDWHDAMHKEDADYRHHGSKTGAQVAPDHPACPKCGSGTNRKGDRYESPDCSWSGANPPHFSSKTATTDPNVPDMRGPHYDPDSSPDPFTYKEGYGHAANGTPYKGYGGRAKAISYGNGYNHGIADLHSRKASLTFEQRMAALHTALEEGTDPLEWVTQQGGVASPANAEKPSEHVSTPAADSGPSAGEQIGVTGAAGRGDNLTHDPMTGKPYGQQSDPRGKGDSRDSGDIYCPSCKGSGANAWDSRRQCTRCKGTGIKRTVQRRVDNAIGKDGAAKSGKEDHNIDVFHSGGGTDGPRRHLPACLTCGWTGEVGEDYGKALDSASNHRFDDTPSGPGHTASSNGMGSCQECHGTGSSDDPEANDSDGVCQNCNGSGDADAYPQGADEPDRDRHEGALTLSEQEALDSEERKGNVLFSGDNPTADKSRSHFLVDQEGHVNWDHDKTGSRRVASIKTLAGIDDINVPQGSDAFDPNAIEPSYKASDSLTTKPRQMPAGSSTFDPVDNGGDVAGAGDVGPEPTMDPAASSQAPPMSTDSVKKAASRLAPMVAEVMQANPGLGIDAAYAIAKQAASYLQVEGMDPLGFGNRGDVADGPLTSRVKAFEPSMPSKPSAPESPGEGAPAAGAGAEGAGVVGEAAEALPLLAL